MKLLSLFLLLLYMSNHMHCLLPPKFQWKIIDFAWEGNRRETALASGDYIPENNMPAGIARWKNKFFITIPRWKKGVPSSLNYIYVNGSQSQPLHPFPTWEAGFVSDNAYNITMKSTVVSTFRVHVDKCDRLWVVDNGVADMSSNKNQILNISIFIKLSDIPTDARGPIFLGELRQVTQPAILIYDLNRNTLLRRYIINDEILRDSSVLTSIVVDIVGKGCEDAYAYIPDMGSNALLVYSMRKEDIWRVENHFFHFDPQVGVYKVGEVEFYWSDGISSAVLIPSKKSSRYRDLYFHPTSSTKQFRMSTRLLRDKYVPPENIFCGSEVLGDRGEKSQATASAFDSNNNVLFYTQLSKNGVSCWNMDRPLTPENVPLIISDCIVLEFPNDIKVDKEGNLWILSNRQSRFLYESMDFNQVNFRVLTAPVTTVVRDTPCEKLSSIAKALSFINRNKTNKI